MYCLVYYKVKHLPYFEILLQSLCIPEVSSAFLAFFLASSYEPEIVVLKSGVYCICNLLWKIQRNSRITNETYCNNHPEAPKHRITSMKKDLALI